MFAVALLPVLAQGQTYPCGGVRAFADGVCGTGREQSPINVMGSLATTMSPDDLALEMKYPQSVDVAYDTDASKWDVSSTDAYVMARGERFNLIQFHMHAPAEHLIDGKVYPAEIHFVHQQQRTGQLLVVGMFFDNDSDLNNTMIDELSTAVSGATTVGLRNRPYVNGVEQHGYFHYDGSLTAGSCAENLIWVVSKYVAPATPEQICGTFSTGIFETARPTNPLNGRSVKESVFVGSQYAPKEAAPATVIEVAPAAPAPVSVSASSESKGDKDEDDDGDSPATVVIHDRPELFGAGAIAAIVVGGVFALTMAGVIGAAVTHKLLSTKSAYVNMSPDVPRTPSTSPMQGSKTRRGP